jgi:hypothetical protein
MLEGGDWEGGWGSRSGWGGRLKRTDGNGCVARVVEEEGANQAEEGVGGWSARVCHVVRDGCEHEAGRRTRCDGGVVGKGLEEEEHFGLRPLDLKTSCIGPWGLEASCIGSAGNKGSRIGPWGRKAACRSGMEKEEEESWMLRPGGGVCVRCRSRRASLGVARAGFRMYNWVAKLCSTCGRYLRAGNNFFVLSVCVCVCVCVYMCVCVYSTDVIKSCFLRM